MFRNSANRSLPTALFLASLIILLAPQVLLTSCGVNPDKPVYDTVNNPDSFPDQAVNLVENIQSGKLDESTAIIDAFAELYSKNPNLLGNNEWKEIVLKLGIKLRHKADQLAKDGIESYSNAAGLYHVASFARPNDPRIQAMDMLFSRWQGEATDSLVSLDRAIRSGNTELRIVTAEIEQLKRFQFADSLSAEFARIYLHDLLFGQLTSNIARKSALVDSLSRSEQAFLSSIGVIDRPIGPIIGRFDSPLIDLVAVDLIPLSDSEYRAEVYFLPGEQINEDLTVAFWVDSYDSISNGLAASSNYFPYDIIPVEASSTWPIDKISIAYRRFSFNWPISAVSVGLYKQSENEVGFLPIISRGITTEDDSTRVSSNLIRISLEPTWSD